ncbi:MAG: MlaC/ttg2D family ABC transporter substrate-binding protein, partial [Rhodanobacteraceae bacterium]
MSRTPILLLTAAFMAIACAVPVGAAAAVKSPQEIVQTMVNQLSKDISGHEAELRRDPERMTQIIDSVVLPNFDVGFASLLVLGPQASKATPAQRVAFERAFRNALTRSFAKGLIDFAQVNVKVLPSHASPDQRRVLVRTQVLEDKGQMVAVDYAFHNDVAHQWKIYDVIIEGISYITLYRSQVNSQIDKDGI